MKKTESAAYGSKYYESDKKGEVKVWGKSSKNSVK
jgi:hypothetical protein